MKNDKKNRKCEYCGRPIDDWRRADIKFCSDRCKYLAFMQKNPEYNKESGVTAVCELPSWMQPDINIMEELKNEHS